MKNTKFHRSYFVSAKKVTSRDGRRALARLVNELDAEFPALPRAGDTDAILDPCLPCFTRPLPGTPFVVLFELRESHVIVRGVR